MTALTNSDGRIMVTYTAAQFGGRYVLIARTNMDGRNLEARDTLTVRVPGLIELTPGEYYELVGAPDNHSGTNDPCRPIFDPPTSLHYHNHFGTQALITVIQNIAVAYDSLHPGIRLRINDMSLEYGGLFDCGSRTVPPNTWRPPHNSHRLGRNADIGFTGINSSNQCVPLNRARLEVKIDYYSGNRITEGNHYHITVN